MTALDSTAPPSVASGKDALRRFAARIEINPQANSVFAYAGDLFHQLENGQTDIGALGNVVQDIYGALIIARADRFRRQHGLPDPDPWAPLRRRLEDIAATGWTAFRSALEARGGGIVFTAHPTFALSQAIRAQFAALVSQPSPAAETALRDSLAGDPRAWSASISLQGEHAEGQAAIGFAQDALSAYARLVFEVARRQFPGQWQALRPALPTIASWIGYDLDGRTDIHWSQSVALRLQEKATQLSRYAGRLNALAAAASRQGGASDQTTASEQAAVNLAALAARAAGASAHAAGQSRAFDADLTHAGNLVLAANALTDSHPGRLTRAQEIIDPLTAMIGAGDLPGDLALDLLVLIAEVEALQLGTARIHLRLNAAQIGTVISRDLGLETENRDLGRSARNQLSQLAACSDPLPVSFADLFLEQSTARRQFMMCAQLLKHVDEGSTIRFLIAESENPATVMGALYMARQYGVADRLDISPLFETPEALETGGRFIEQLLEEPEYMRYLKQRGYLSVQLGFSDAGRFIGQVSADMAIERIHNLISRAVARTGVSLCLLIFNTHGESMGRGAWPGTFSQRFDHLLTPWTRLQSQRRGVPLRHEVSFQGGDGFLHFADRALAQSTFAAFALHLLSAPDADAERDPFYQRTDLVWDFYRALRRWHERLFSNEDYGHVLSDFATSFQVKAGSRQTRRSGGPQGPRAMRAISHNATLQQLGIPLNTAAGIGSALRREQDQVNDLIEVSPRLRSLIGLASFARAATSVPVLRAYAAVYDPSYWVALSRTDATDKTLAYRRIYYLLQDRQTSTSIEKIANTLSIDLTKFDPMLARMTKAPSAQERHEARLDVHILHAIRQALMMKALALAGRLPTVSRRHEETVVDIMNLIKAMRIGEAIAILRSIFPASLGSVDQLASVTEPGHMRDHPSKGYDQLHSEIITPLDQIDRQLQTITQAVSQAYGAYG